MFRLKNKIRPPRGECRQRLELGRRALQIESLEDRRVLAVVAETGSTGSGAAIDIRQDNATINYAIALQGLFPSRSLTAEDPNPQALSSGSGPTIGTIMKFAGHFAPRGWALCDGQLLSISGNEALFSILGTTYGGDGRTSFALPDLRGRVPVGVGTGPGLSAVALGQKFGAENVNLNQSNIPSHDHLVSEEPTTGLTGGTTAVDLIQPSLGLNPVIHIAGTFPSSTGAGSLGTIDWFAGNFPPRNTMFAHGQILDISSNSALFSLLGTTYGGDGRTTFALPDLRGRTPVHAGSGMGTTPVNLGEKGGRESINLGLSEMASHNHTIAGRNSTFNSGGSQPFDIRQPYLGLNFEIALTGIYPSRSLEAEDPSATDDSDVSGLISGDDVVDLETASGLIEGLADEGIQRWIAAGISDEQVAQLEAITYQIADLDHGFLALAGGDHNLVTIDADASNTGWFVDDTPRDDHEFASTDPNTGELLATDSAAIGHYDLLTTIMHEQGHIIGISHTEHLGVMHNTLGKGGRWNPVAQDLDDHDHDDHSHDVESGFLNAGGDPFLAQVGMFAGNFAMGNYALTNGDLLSVAQNSALFSLLGTTYGGDGRTTFALPDFRGRVVIHSGNGPGLSSYSLGSTTSGMTTRTMTISQLPAHTHTVTIEGLKINGVKVGSTDWTDTFRMAVDSTGAGFGYPIPTGIPQTAPLPWANINQIQLSFTKDIGNSFDDSLIGLGGFHTADYRPHFSNMTYDSNVFTVTILLDTYLGDDQLVLVASDLLMNASGSSLDGEWITRQSSSESGDGCEGGNFEYRFDVLPGDINQSGAISSNDGFSALRLQSQEVGDPFYLAFADIDGSGRISSNDGFFALARQNTELPKGTPTVPVLPAPARVNSIFAARFDRQYPLDFGHNELNEIIDQFATDLPPLRGWHE